MKVNPAILAILVPLGALNAQSFSGSPGDPLPWLTAAELQLFRSGQAEFAKEYPALTSGGTATGRASTVTCAGCHQLSISNLGGPLYGAGLIEGIPDELILAQVRRPEALALGIGGRATQVVDSETGRLRVGRFGRRAQFATLLDASADNLARHMGIAETASRSEPPDPATGLRTIDRLAAYAKFLAPVGPAAATADPKPGNTIFDNVGCALCHTRSITTAPAGTLNPIDIHPFSDFLLHDIGTGDEVRTTPLWGLRLRKNLLSDGSAPDLASAIARHKREATIVRQRYEALTDAQRQALIDYLKTL